MLTDSLRKGRVALLALNEGNLGAHQHKYAPDVSLDLTEDLTQCTKEELAALTRVLIAVLHCTEPQELLAQILSAIEQPFQVSGCALYESCENSIGLRLAYTAGKCRPFLPDLVPFGSDLFQSITLCRPTPEPTFTFEQLALFSDQPAAVFAPITDDENLAGALAVVSINNGVDFLVKILHLITMALEMLGDRFALAGPPDPALGAAKASEAGLTSREAEVLNLLAAGLPNKEIAQRLYISDATCRHHVQSILQKLNVHSRTAAVAIALAKAKEEESG